MALTKRTYVDGETIITAQNLNDIQDEIIAHESNKVPITRTVNSKALSANITLSASDVGAVPTTRTVNSKALSSNITLAAGDIGYNSSATYSASTVGKAISDLSGAINSEKGRAVMLADGTEIPANSNLNSYTTIGNYYIKTNANAETITNVPWAKAGRLTVSKAIDSSTSYIRQEYTPHYSAGKYTRESLTNGSTWTEWNATADTKRGLSNNLELSDTASKSYSVGEYLVSDGNFKKVTAAISSGASITSNNTLNTTVGAELTGGLMELQTSGTDTNLVGYAKFNSGLLVCWGGVGTYSGSSSSTTVSITFGHAFVGHYALTLSAANNAAGSYDGCKLTYYDNTATGFTARCVNTEANKTSSGRYIAIGKWK